jgi:hypothetical protein
VLVAYLESGPGWRVWLFWQITAASWEGLGLLAAMVVLMLVLISPRWVRLFGGCIGDMFRALDFAACEGERLGLE